MKSTGVVKGFGKTFARHISKLKELQELSTKEGNVFISVRDHDKEPICEVASELISIGFKVCNIWNIQSPYTKCY